MSPAGRGRRFHRFQQRWPDRRERWRGRATSTASSGPLGGVQPVGLVQDVDGDVGQLRQVLAGVVRAEQQLPARREASTQVRLGTATVASVGCGQLTRECSSHVSLPSVWRCGIRCRSPDPRTPSLLSNSQARRFLPCLRASPSGHGTRLAITGCLIGLAEPPARTFRRSTRVPSGGRSAVRVSLSGSIHRWA